MTCPTLAFDAHYGKRVCGIDEAGRGCWAGPVVAAAVLWHEGIMLPTSLNDSKKLTAKKRDELYDFIVINSHYAIAQASAEEIDHINILQASLLAMQRAFNALGASSDCALIDGNHAPKLACATHAIVKGDSLSPAIAAASILAKVTRDRLMSELANAHPQYGFERHFGYGTRHHSEALERFGVTEHHRRSYAPIRTLLEAAA